MILLDELVDLHNYVFYCCFRFKMAGDDSVGRLRNADASTQVGRFRQVLALLFVRVSKKMWKDYLTFTWGDGCLLAYDYNNLQQHVNLLINSTRWKNIVYNNYCCMKHNILVNVFNKSQADTPWEGSPLLASAAL